MDSMELNKLPRPLTPTLLQQAVAADASAVTKDATAKTVIFGSVDIRKEYQK